MTGLYMKINFPELYGSDEVKRLLFRTNHIYILFGSFVHLCIMGSPPQKKVFSYILLVGQICLMIGFFQEHALYYPKFQRPYSFSGTIFFLIGILGHIGFEFYQKNYSTKSNSFIDS